MKIKGLIVMAAVLALMLGSCAKQSITKQGGFAFICLRDNELLRIAG